MRPRPRAALSAGTSVLAAVLAGCTGGGGEAAPRPTVSAAPTAGALAPGVAGRLAYTAGGHVHVVDVAADGTPRSDRLLGVVDPDAVLSWSRGGELLVWLETAGDASRLHEWDAARGTEAQVPLPTGTLQARAVPSGAVTATDSGIDRWDGQGRHLGRSELPDVGGETSLAAAPDVLVDDVVAENDTEKRGDLRLVAPSGAGTALGSVPATDLGGSPTVPRWGPGTTRTAGGVAVATQAAQDGTCAAGASVQLVDTTARKATGVPLPTLKGAAVQVLDVSAAPGGGVGVVVAGCVGDGPVPSAYLELAGDRFVVRDRDVSVEARGPAGLVAVRRGGVRVVDLAPGPAPGSTLEIVGPGGVRHPVGDGATAVWSPAGG